MASESSTVSTKKGEKLCSVVNERYERSRAPDILAPLSRGSRRHLDKYSAFINPYTPNSHPSIHPSTLYLCPTYTHNFNYSRAFAYARISTREAFCSATFYRCCAWAGSILAQSFTYNKTHSPNYLSHRKVISVGSLQKFVRQKSPGYPTLCDIPKQHSN